MKKLLFTILIIFLFPIVAFASDNDIVINNIEKDSFVGDVTELSNPSYEDLEIKYNVKFLNIGDSITYKINLTNNSDDDYNINDNIKDLTNDNFDYSLKYDNEENIIKANSSMDVFLTIKYKKTLDDSNFSAGKYKESKSIVINISDKEITFIDVGDTDTFIKLGLGFVFVIFMILIGICLFLNKRRQAKVLTLILGIIILYPKTMDALKSISLTIDSNIVLEQYPCTYNGELVQGAEYVDGQYTYRYMQQNRSNVWDDITVDGWGVVLTDRTSTEPVTSKLCTSINKKPIVSMAYMFYNSKTTSIDTSSFDTSNVVSFYYTFAFARDLESLDVSKFETKNANNMNDMFNGLAKVPELDVSNFDTRNSMNDLGYMFDGCNSIKKLDVSNFILGHEMGSRFFANGSACEEYVAPTSLTDHDTWLPHYMYDDDYNEYKTTPQVAPGVTVRTIPSDKIYIKYNTKGGTLDVSGKAIDKVSGGTTKYGELPTPTLEGRTFEGWYNGTTKVTSDSNITGSTKYIVLTAKWSEAKSYIWDGSTFNVKAKTIAGDSYPSYNTTNENIKEIKKASELPNINLTNDNIISENDSQTTSYIWFDDGILYYYCSDGKIGIKSVGNMFAYFENLEKIDLSGFDFSQVETFNNMFKSLISLKELDLSLIDTSSGNYFQNMFYGLPSLEKLDMSGIDLRYGATYGMFNGVTNLKEVKTPKNLSNSKNTTFGEFPRMIKCDGYELEYKYLNAAVPPNTWCTLNIE